MNIIKSFEAFKLILEAKIEDVYDMYYKDKIEDQSVFYALVDADPTTVKKGDEYKKKGNYVDWIIKTYIKEFTNKSSVAVNRFLKEDLSFITSDLEFFHKNKGKFDIKNRDINSFKSFKDLYEFVKEKKQKEDEFISNREKEETIKKDAIKLYSDEKIEVVVPKTEEASCYYGKNTRWCTAADNNNQFDAYDDELYIIIDKEKGNKYQLNFSSEQYMDESDYHVELDDLKYSYGIAFEAIVAYMYKELTTKNRFELSTYILMITDDMYDKVFAFLKKKGELTFLLNDTDPSRVIKMHREGVLDKKDVEKYTEFEVEEEDGEFLYYEIFKDFSSVSEIFENEEFAEQILDTEISGFELFYNEYSPLISDVLSSLNEENMVKLKSRILDTFEDELALDEDGEEIEINSENIDKIDLEKTFEDDYLYEVSDDLKNKYSDATINKMESDYYEAYSNAAIEFFNPAGKFKFMDVKTFVKDEDTGKMVETVQNRLAILVDLKILEERMSNYREIKDIYIDNYADYSYYELCTQLIDEQLLDKIIVPEVYSFLDDEYFNDFLKDYDFDF